MIMILLNSLGLKLQANAVADKAKAPLTADQQMKIRIKSSLSGAMPNSAHIHQKSSFLSFKHTRGAPRSPSTLLSSSSKQEEKPIVSNC
jgi:hypothetical protein